MKAVMTAALLSVSVLAFQAVAQAPGRSVWEGVYTTAQAATGKAAYEAKCLTCHGAEMNGAEMAPPLAGGVFLGNWGGQQAGSK